MVKESGDAGSAALPRMVVIDRAACMGSGNCAYWSPEVFDLDDEGIAVVIGEVTDHEDRVQLAATNCPTSAIHFEETVRRQVPGHTPGSSAGPKQSL
jgi:ferredoxin